MDKKVVLVTGGSSGIGKSIGIFLVAKGFTVYGTTRNIEKALGFGNFTLLQMDVGHPKSVLDVCNEIIRREGQLDVVINNAGIGITGPIEETPPAEMQKAFDTNFFGPINVMKAVLPQMRIQKKGLIINITSIAGYMGLPYRGIYSATKGALELVTEAMRMETRDFGIQITNLAPGDFATNIAAGRYHAPVLTDSPYRLPYGNTLKMMDRDVNNGGDPQKVAEKVYHIITKDSPKVHYRVGAFMQRISLLLKKILPDKVFEKLLLNHYKL